LAVARRTSIGNRVRRRALASLHELHRIGLWPRPRHKSLVSPGCHALEHAKFVGGLPLHTSLAEPCATEVEPCMTEDEFIRSEVARFALKSPRPLSMQDVLDMLDPERIAKFLHVEVLVRFAERIRSIQDIPEWEEVPELADVCAAHTHAFRELRLVKRQPTMDQFTRVVRRILKSQRNLPKTVAFAMHRLRVERGPEYGSSFADRWLDDFLLNCIGTEMLMGQYLACVAMQHKRTAHTFKGGVIDPDCNLPQLCRDVAVDVRQMCKDYTGCAPIIRTKVYQENGEPRVCHVPGFLKFILTEVLKNSCRATAEIVKTKRHLKKRPINIILCADEHHASIRITDRAGGIPFEVGSHVWSYLYTTRSKGQGRYGERATSLAGYGVGLPISRLYAKYLGGSLNLISMPGYGCSAYLFLSRLSGEQREVVPDCHGTDHRPDEGGPERASGGT